MGRIKSTFVKTSGMRIYEKGSDEFTENFDENKKIIEKFAKISSKRLRNSIAGYVTRLAKKNSSQS